jgi:hypothetical protein
LVAIGIFPALFICQKRGECSVQIHRSKLVELQVAEFEVKVAEDKGAFLVHTKESLQRPYGVAGGFSICIIANRR